MGDELHESFIRRDNDPIIDPLNKVIIYSVKFLAVLMVVVILWSLVDVVVHMYNQISHSIISRKFNTEDLIEIFGAFLAVLIAIEIYLNIVFYLKKDAVHVPLVLATALTAVARKVIILDYSDTTPLAIFATASVILAAGITYWLVIRQNQH